MYSARSDPCGVLFAFRYRDWESGDILASGMDMIPEIGSLLYVHQAGAYGFSMASRYNGFPLPGEYLQKKSGEIVCIRQPENDKWLSQGLQQYGD